MLGGTSNPTGRSGRFSSSQGVPGDNASSRMESASSLMCLEDENRRRRSGRLFVRSRRRWRASHFCGTQSRRRAFAGRRRRTLSVSGASPRARCPFHGGQDVANAAMQDQTCDGSRAGRLGHGTEAGGSDAHPSFGRRGWLQARGRDPEAPSLVKFESRRRAKASGTAICESAVLVRMSGTR